MFKIKLWAAPFLLLAIGAIAFLVGTTALHDQLVPLSESGLSAAKSAAQSVLLELSEKAATSAAKLTVDASLRELAENGGEITAEQKELLLQKGDGRLPRPAFAALLNKKGEVVGHTGIDPKLPPEAGFPWVKDTLSGVVRDAPYTVDGKPFLLGMAPFMSTSGTVGMVVVGWEYDAKLVTQMSNIIGASIVITDKASKAVVRSEGLPDEAVAATAGTPAPVDLNLPVPDLPLPVLVPDVNRYGNMTMPLVSGSADFMLTVVRDNNAAFRLIAYVQLALAGSVFFLFLFMAWSVMSVQRSIAKPMEIITDHLGQHAQGANVGIIPEAGLSGPFVRLAKQINMILQGSHGSRGTSPIAPPVGDGSIPSFQPTPSGSTSVPPMGPPMGGDLPDDGAAMPPVPGPPAEDIAPLAQAPVSDDLANSALAGLFDDGGANADPLAAFRTDNAPPPGPPPPAVAPPGPPPPTPPAASAPLPGMAAPSGAPAAAPAADEGFNPEATVMFQVPQELINESASPPVGGMGGPPMGAPPPPAGPPAGPPLGAPPPPMSSPPQEDRTVVAQIPQELLSAAAPKPTANDDTAHYQEVYQDFIRTRQQCGEETSDLTYDRFVAKLMKNRQQIMDKYNCKSVRFQVYVKAGKAALRAVPVRE